MTNLFWKRNTLILCRDLLSSIGWLFGFPPSLAKTNCTSRFAKSSFWKDSPTFLELFHTKTISNSNRSLFHLFSSPKINNEVIRPRGHDNVVTLSSQRPVVGRFIFLELFFFFVFVSSISLDDAMWNIWMFFKLNWIGKGFLRSKRLNLDKLCLMKRQKLNQARISMASLLLL